MVFYLNIVVGFPEFLEAVRESANASVQLSLLPLQQIFVEIDQLKEAFWSGVVVPPLLLQEALR